MNASMKASVISGANFIRNDMQEITDQFKELGMGLDTSQAEIKVQNLDSSFSNLVYKSI